MEKANSNQIEDIMDIILEIAEKYNLGPFSIIDNPEIEELLEKFKTPEERLNALKNLPLEKFKYIAREFFERRISPSELSAILKEKLKISEEMAERISKDLKEKIFGLKKLSPEIKEVEKKEVKRDIYREPIE